jgi:hypothetical protein
VKLSLKEQGTLRIVHFTYFDFVSSHYVVRIADRQLAPSLTLILRALHCAHPLRAFLWDFLTRMIPESHEICVGQWFRSRRIITKIQYS